MGTRRHFELLEVLCIFIYELVVFCGQTMYNYMLCTLSLCIHFVLTLYILQCRFSVIFLGENTHLKISNFTLDYDGSK